MVEIMDTDDVLLRKFTDTGNEEAFSSLVMRHAPMVFGVALRRTGSTSIAEDVSQKVFTVLAQKARTVKRESLSGWLHKASFLEASNAARKAARYQAGLKQITTYQQMKSDQSHDGAWDDVVIHLDEALSNLPSRARHLLVLRYYEQKSIQEIAAESQCKEAACRKRLQRSLDKLTSALRRRGVVTTPLALGAMMVGQTLCSSPSSAASIAAETLKAISALHTAPTLSITYTIMKTSSAIKVSATALILAIPIGTLWMQNQALKDDLDRSQSAETHETPTPPARRLSSPIKEEKLQEQIASRDLTTEETEDSNNPLANFFSPQTMLEGARSSADKEAEKELDRIALVLPNLTDVQKEEIAELLQSRNNKQLDDIIEVFKSGGLRDLTSLSDDQQAALLKADPNYKESSKDDEELMGILTEEQYAQYVQNEDDRRVKEAEYNAMNALESLNTTLNLNTEQEDAIFQELAQLDLVEDPVANDGMEEPSPFDRSSSREEARDDIIRSHLTQSQVEAYNQQRVEEKREQEEMLEMMQTFSGD